MLGLQYFKQVLCQQNVESFTHPSSRSYSKTCLLDFGYCRKLTVWSWMTYEGVWKVSFLKFLDSIWKVSDHCLGDTFKMFYVSPILYLGDLYCCHTRLHLGFSAKLRICKFHLARWSNKVVLFPDLDHPKPPTHPQLNFFFLCCAMSSPKLFLPSTKYVRCPHPMCYSRQQSMCGVPPSQYTFFLCGVPPNVVFFHSGSVLDSKQNWESGKFKLAR